MTIHSRNCPDFPGKSRLAGAWVFAADTNWSPPPLLSGMPSDRTRGFNFFARVIVDLAVRPTARQANIHGRTIPADTIDVTNQQKDCSPGGNHENPPKVR